jgi:tetratricopeptide (TPR) repeat protein
VNRAIPFLERGLQLGENADFPGAIIHAGCGLGYAYNLVERSEQAITPLERAWSLAEAGGFLHWGVMCLMHLADAYSLTRREADARSTIDRALTIVHDAGFRALEAWAFYLQGDILGRGPKADLTSAMQAKQAALALANDLGMRPLSGQCEFGLGQSFSHRGDSGRARLHYDRAIAMFREMGMQSWSERAESAIKAL